MSSCCANLKFNSLFIKEKVHQLQLKKYKAMRSLSFEWLSSFSIFP